MVYFLALVVAVGATTATPTPLEWQSDYGKALVATRADSRPLLVVLDVPSNPKTAVATKQVAKDATQEKLLGAYQLCRVDASTAYGKKVAKAFGASSFPYTAILDKSASVVLCRKVGQLSNDQWQKTLAKYQKGDRKSKVLHTTAYRGNQMQSNVYPSVVIPADCPSCRLRVQQ